MSEKETKKKTKRKTKTKVSRLEDDMKEIEQEAKKYVEEHSASDKYYPPVVLPCRGYFRKLDHGLNVENLQRALNQVLDCNLPVTGIIDDATIGAVTEFEKEYGGYPNGMFGTKELIAYNKLRGVE